MKYYLKKKKKKKKKNNIRRTYLPVTLTTTIFLKIKKPPVRKT